MTSSTAAAVIELTPISEEFSIQASTDAGSLEQSVIKKGRNKRMKLWRRGEQPVTKKSNNNNKEKLRPSCFRCKLIKKIKSEGVSQRVNIDLKTDLNPYIYKMSQAAKSANFNF